MQSIRLTCTAIAMQTNQNKPVRSVSDRIIAQFGHLHDHSHFQLELNADTLGKYRVGSIYNISIEEVQ